LKAPRGNRVAANQPKAAPTSKPVEAASGQAVKSFLLLALVVSLRRMLVSRFGFVDCLGRMLLGAHMIVAAMLLRSGPMGFRSLLMMFGSLLVHVLRHRVSLRFEEVKKKRSRLSMVPHVGKTRWTQAETQAPNRLSR
jgi:hypothetical protein